MNIINSAKTFKSYLYLLQQLVIRDFKVKYKRSILGVLWSILNPLFMMIILSFVFGFFAKGNMDKQGIDFSVYLLIGLVIFNYFSEATNLAMGSIVSNFNLITKVYMPKYIFPMSKVFSSAINLLFSLVALYGIIIVRNTRITFVHLLLPFDLICVIIFALGVAMFLAALTVFFRDMFYIYGVILTAWMYLTPIVYNLDQIPVEYQQYFKFNPLYHFVNYARTIILYDQVPTLGQHLICIGIALITLIIGSLFFRKMQDKFIYFI
jgi:ABC-2 type transport system permease protein